MTESRALIVDTLRGRVIRGIQSGTLRPGDRLPSAPELAGEFEVDHRAIIGAYRALEEEGLVERRPRGGVYIAERAAERGGMSLPEAWFADVLVQGLGRELPGPQLHEWMRRSLETVRLRAVFITETLDQAFGIARELRDDYGLEADWVLVDDVRDAEPLPLPVRRADLLVTTPAHDEWVRPVAAALGIPLVTIEVRPELLAGELTMLLRKPAYVVVASEQFGEMLRRFFRDVPDIDNLHVVVHGRDALADIPAEAPVYVTQRVRAQLAGERIPGRLLPPARTIASHSARELFAFIVRANHAAMSSRPRARS